MTGLQTQKDLFLTIKTAAGEDVFIMHKMEGTEAISELFEFTAEVYSMTAKNTHALSMDFSKILQKDAVISITLDKTKIRYFNGIVTQIMQGPTIKYGKKTKDKAQEKTYFKLTIRPKMWLLTRRENCRIFQKKSAVEIMKTIFEDHNVTLENQLTKAGSAKRDFCVQYNETDFAFVSRLMEAEGIYYFFTHTANTHTLVLFDGTKPYKACQNAPQIKVLDPFVPGLQGIQEINIQQQIVSDTFTTKDYSFETPKVNLKAHAKGKTSSMEVYNYPGNYTMQASGETIASIRMDAIDCSESLIMGRSNVPYMLPGAYFKLTNSLRTSLNNLEYIVFSVTHYVINPDDEEAVKFSSDVNEVPDVGEVKKTYYNTFSCFPKTLKYKPLLKTPRPRIYGTQTAVVTGKAEEEIWTDKYGRVLVKFPWDLSETKNENTSCWIRVMQPWTGQNWGIQFTPRIGQEVVVTFLNGDPDYPLITGCVYNADNLPPYLPAEPTKSTIKTNSSKHAKGDPAYNELRFEDKTDKEEVYIRAQQDLVIDVINGSRTTTLKAKKDKVVTDTLEIMKGHRVKNLVEGNERVTLTKGNRSINLKEGNDSLTLSKGDRTVKVTGKQDHDIKENCTLTVGGNLTIKVTGNISMESQEFSIKCTAFKLNASTSAKVQTVDLNMQADASAKIKTAALTIKADATAEISAGATMTVKGGAEATFQSSAMVNVKGAMVTVEAQAMANLKGAMVQVQGSGMAQVSGGIVMIG